MRISDWSSDVCSSDLRPSLRGAEGDAAIQSGARPPLDCFARATREFILRACKAVEGLAMTKFLPTSPAPRPSIPASGDRKSVVQGKRVSVRVDLGGVRNIKKTKNNKRTHNNTK